MDVLPWRLGLGQRKGLGEFKQYIISIGGLRGSEAHARCDAGS